MRRREYLGWLGALGTMAAAGCGADVPFRSIEVEFEPSPIGALGVEFDLTAISSAHTASAPARVELELTNVSEYAWHLDRTGGETGIGCPVLADRGLASDPDGELALLEASDRWKQLATDGPRWRLDVGMTSDAPCDTGLVYEPGQSRTFEYVVLGPEADGGAIDGEYLPPGTYHFDETLGYGDPDARAEGLRTVPWSFALSVTDPASEGSDRPSV